MTSIALSQQSDQSPDPEVRIDPIRKQAVVIDRANLPSGCPQLAELEALTARTIARYQIVILEETLALGEKMLAIQFQYEEQLGCEEGKKAFHNNLKTQYGKRYRIAKFALKLFDWYKQLNETCRRAIRCYTKEWNLFCLDFLPGLGEDELDDFLWSLNLLKQDEQTKITGKLIKAIINAIRGIHRLQKNQALSIPDWAFIVGKCQADRHDFLAKYKEIKEFALATASKAGRTEIIIEDAIAALQQLGFNTSAIDVGAKEKTPPAEKKVFTQSDRDRAIEEATLALKQELAEKEAALQQLREQNEALKEKEAEIASKQQEIEWLKKLLDEARQEKTSSPSTLSKQSKDPSVVPQSPNLSLKIEDLSPVIPSTDPISTIFPHPTNTPPLTNKYPIEFEFAARATAISERVQSDRSLRGDELESWRKRKFNKPSLSKGFGNTRNR